MKKILCFCLSFCSMLGFSQSKYFEKSLGWEYIQNGQIIFEKIDNNFVVIGDATVGTNGYWWHLFNLQISGNGTCSDEPIFYESPENYGGAIFDGISTEYGFAALGYMVGPFASDVRPYLLKLNENGEFLDSTWVDFCDQCSTYTLCRTPDGGYMLGGSVRQAISGNPGQFNIYPYLIRLNEQGEVVWDTAYTLPLWGGENTKITTVLCDTLTDTYYVIGRISASNSEGDVVWAHIDGEDGDLLSYHKFGNEQPFTDERTSFMMQISDGGWLFSYGIYNAGYLVSGRLIKLNFTGDTILWNKEIFVWGGTSKVIELADSSFIVGGVASPSPSDPPFNAAIAHVSANGDSVYWKRSYGGSRPDYIYDFTPTNDGGYFFVGRTESPELGVPLGHANVYLLKTNCMGLLTEPAAAFSQSLNNETGSMDFQNLSQYVYPDSIDGGHYIWDFGDGSTSVEQNPSHTYTQNGAYVAKLTAVVCSDTSLAYQSICIGVSPHPAPAFSYVLQNDSTLSFTNTSSNAQGGIFTWHFGDGSPPLQTIDPNTPQQHTYTQSGQHLVTLSVVLCGDTTNYTQTVITYATGLAQHFSDGEVFTIMPNPANQQLSISSNVALPNSATFVLYNMLGQAVKSTTLSSTNNTQVSVTDIPSGIYLYQIINQNQTMQYGKVTVVH